MPFKCSCGILLINLNLLDSVLFQMLTTKKRAYQWVAIAAVFLEQVRLDENRYEERDYVSFIESIEDRGLYRLLCFLQLDLLSNGSSLDSKLTKEAMKQKYRNIGEQSMRHIRDYIIFRDTTKIMSYLHFTFLSIAFS